MESEDMGKGMAGVTTTGRKVGPAIHSIIIIITTIITNTIATKQTERQRSQSGTTERPRVCCNTRRGPAP